ncbi:hypothetical protein MNBD_NITROSPIRAE01-248 [hydrothermal vent metagenome]|uniref:Uncharacterized protein n=1 Tax=hydrothermal vent metagenome TaxID=652676 RepID=A0A3B1CPZ1_9ZZZZ
MDLKIDVRINRRDDYLEKVGFQSSRRGHFKWSFNLISIFFIGVLLSGCHFQHKKIGLDDGGFTRPPAQDGPQVVNPVPLSDMAEKELKFTENDVAIVFSIDKKGNMQGFRPKGTTFKENIIFPLHAEEIEVILGISAVKTKNPKFCWTNSYGQSACVVW